MNDVAKPSAHRDSLEGVPAWDGWLREIRLGVQTGSSSSYVLRSVREIIREQVSSSEIHYIPENADGRSRSILGWW